MLLHDCEPTGSASSGGLPLSMVLWLWGGGSATAIAQPRGTRVYSSDGVGTARSQAVRHRRSRVCRGVCKLVRGARWSGPAPGGLGRALQPARLARWSSGTPGYRQLNARWFEHLPEALSSGLLVKSVELLVHRLGDATLRPDGVWRAGGVVGVQLREACRGAPSTRCISRVAELGLNSTHKIVRRAGRRPLRSRLGHGAAPGAGTGLCGAGCVLRGRAGLQPGSTAARSRRCSVSTRTDPALLHAALRGASADPRGGRLRRRRRDELCAWRCAR